MRCNRGRGDRASAGSSRFRSDLLRGGCPGVYLQAGSMNIGPRAQNASITLEDVNARSAGALQERFTHAVDSLSRQLQDDRSILAAILCGSLSHDRVWDKSDVDLVLVTIDDRMWDQPSRQILTRRPSLSASSSSDRPANLSGAVLKDLCLQPGARVAVARWPLQVDENGFPLSSVATAETMDTSQIDSMAADTFKAVAVDRAEWFTSDLPGILAGFREVWSLIWARASGKALEKRRSPEFCGRPG